MIKLYDDPVVKITHEAMCEAFESAEKQSLRHSIQYFPLFNISAQGSGHDVVAGYALRDSDSGLHGLARFGKYEGHRFAFYISPGSKIVDQCFLLEVDENKKKGYLKVSPQ